MNLMNHRLMADVQTDIYVETDRQTYMLRQTDRRSGWQTRDKQK